MTGNYYRRLWRRQTRESTKRETQVSLELLTSFFRSLHASQRWPISRGAGSTLRVFFSSCSHTTIRSNDKLHQPNHHGSLGIAMQTGLSSMANELRQVNMQAPQWCQQHRYKAKIQSQHRPIHTPRGPLNTTSRWLNAKQLQNTTNPPAIWPYNQRIWLILVANYHFHGLPCS